MQFLMILSATAATVFMASHSADPPRSLNSMGECAPGVHQQKAKERKAAREAGQEVDSYAHSGQQYYCLSIDGRWIWIDPGER
jgi:hypothetical protein